MQILLAAATPFEIAPAVAKNTGVDVLHTGVGCPLTMYSLLKRIHQFDYDIVLQAGIAGTFKETLHLTDVVLVSEDRFGDIGISENNIFSSVFEKGFADADAFPFSGGALKNNTALLRAFELSTATAISVGTVTDSVTVNDGLLQKYNPDIEAMEGAALHYVCLQEDIPFLQLRAISNKVGERDKLKWKMDESIVKLNEALLELIRKLHSGQIITPKQPR